MKESRTGAQEQHILQGQLEAYCAAGLYPMHMPGHKRNLTPVPGLPYDWDVTELPGAGALPGTDDLHHADGILREAMERTSRLFGSRRTWYLVNGSTCGILAAVYAAAGTGGEVIAARNCHKSVFHAAELLDLTVHWLLPEPLAAWDIYGSVPPHSVECLLRAHPGTKAVVITSPTYEGIVSDISRIAAVCRAAGVLLIVDEAHGAHLGLCREGRDDFPDSAVHLGADIVVQSAHKTLPSLTQTALLHLGRGPLATEGLARRIDHALDIFETSSPSYPLMASLDGCTGILAGQGGDLFRAWHSQIRQTDALLDGLRELMVLRPGRGTAPAPVPTQSEPKRECSRAGEAAAAIYACDRSRFLLRARRDRSVTGAAMASFLMTEGGIVPEMHCGRNVLLMSGCGDTSEGWDRVRTALAKLNAWLEKRREETQPGRPCHTHPAESPYTSEHPHPAETLHAAEENAHAAAENAHAAAENAHAAEGIGSVLPAVPDTVMTPCRAQRLLRDGQVREVPAGAAAGCISAEYVMAYPPGIPLLLPGERIAEGTVQMLRTLTAQGTHMVYSASRRRGTIMVVREPCANAPQNASV